MPLSRISLAELSEEHLQALVDDKVSEGATIEFKRVGPGNAEDQKKEFLYDVSSFANAGGGDLILGIDEHAGYASALLGLPGTDTDVEINRLDAMARTGIKPVIAGIQFRPIPLGNGASVIVIRIPKSWNPPHQVVYQNTFRFYGRGARSKVHLDVDQLRSLFSLSESAAERLRLFRIDRVAKIIAGDTPIPVERGPKTVDTYCAALGVCRCKGSRS